MILKVSLKFAKLADALLGAFAKNILEKMTGNAAYPTPPVTMVALDAAIGDFNTKLGAAENGGKLQTSQKNDSRQSLVTKLRLLAGYVQITCNNDLTTLISSGFDSQSTDRGLLTLDNPEALVVKNGNANQLVAKLTPPVKNANMYEAHVKPDGGDWLPSVFTGDSQHITFDGLTSGVIYTVSVRALGGANGTTDWTPEVKHRVL